MLVLKMGGVCAVNCFPAAVLMGLRAHGLTIPVPEVAVHDHPATQHQALREVLLKMVMEAREGDLCADAKCTQARLAACLKIDEYIFHDVAVFVVELLKCVSINTIMAKPGMGALTVTKFAGEKVIACECWPAVHAFFYFLP